MWSRTVLVLRDPAGSGGLVTSPVRTTDRVLARMFGASLDHRLAAGHAPESGRLLGVRAQQIVALRRRRELACHWEHLLDVAQRQPPGVPRAPLCRDRIVAAEAEVRNLAAHLRFPLPVMAAGVAGARVLLTDATGPLYNRRDRTALPARLRQIIAQLDPAVPLQSLVRSNT
jgi:hypothetical protein